MKERLLAAVGPMLGLALFAVSVGMIHHELYAYHYHDVLEHLSAIPVERLAAAGLFTVLFSLLKGLEHRGSRRIKSACIGRLSSVPNQLRLRRILTFGEPPFKTAAFSRSATSPRGKSTRWALGSACDTSNNRIDAAESRAAAALA